MLKGGIQNSNKTKLYLNKITYLCIRKKINDSYRY